jgi:modulator of FtsH protease
MYDNEIAETGTVDTVLSEQAGVLGKVLGLVGFAFVFTACGAVIGPMLGTGWLMAIAAGTFITLFALLGLKEVSPVNLGLMYAFCTLEGMVLGMVLQTYIAAGQGNAVLQAGAATALITLVAGAQGARTARDLSSFGNLLLFGLIGVIAVSVIGIILQSSLINFIASGVAVAIFTGFIVYDLNQAANVRRASEGDAIMLAVNIYLDLLNLFLNLLSLLGGDD